MDLGRYRLSVHNHGFFRLDGGAMFGSVPKTLWEKLAPPDENNRILLATRSLIVDDGVRRLMIDCGCGDKWTEKTRAIFCIPDGPYQPLPGVTDLLLTHLHFDHAGGVSSLGGTEEGRRSKDEGRGAEGQRDVRANGRTFVPNYPGAHHYALDVNVENAQSPHPREKASYFPEDVGVLDQVPHTLTQDGDEVWPGITVHRSDGHTRGLQWIKVQAGGESYVYPADLIPTSKHLPVPYVMGYDMCAETSMREKAAFLKQALEEDWIIVFEHDPEIAAGRVGIDDRGRHFLKEAIALPEA